MNRLYKYSGLISVFSIDKQHGPTADMILYDMSNERIAPTRIAVHGEIANYISELEWTDDEERYIASDYYYDSNLYLVYISIPSINPHIPAKIIAGPMLKGAPNWDFVIFGQEKHIDVQRPEPMSEEEYFAWLEYKRRNEIYAYEN